MYFDRFDICEARYLYVADYHGGQGSELYKVFGRLNNLGFKPSPLLSYDNLSENGKDIYDNLVNRRHLQ